VSRDDLQISLLIMAYMGVTQVPEANFLVYKIKSDERKRLY
jgi:hypothetical protein